jgi:hypothetical protein
MSIILDEYEWAEQVINNPSLGTKPTETLGRVARYYFANHYSKKEVRDLLDDFVRRCDPTASLVKWGDTLDYITKNSAKRKIICMDSVDITKAELDKIGKLGGILHKRLAFTLLCLAKYWDHVSEKNNGWVNTGDKEILQMANIKVPVARQCELFGDLIKAKYIASAKRVDNLNVRVLFITDGPVELKIVDFRNLGYQYMKYIGENYFECQSCGLVVKGKSKTAGPKQKYCPDCAVHLKTQASVNSVMRRRYSNIQLPQ